MCHARKTRYVHTSLHYIGPLEILIIRDAASFTLHSLYRELLFYNNYYYIVFIPSSTYHILWTRTTYFYYIISSSAVLHLLQWEFIKDAFKTSKNVILNVILKFNIKKVIQLKVDLRGLKKSVFILYCFRIMFLRISFFFFRFYNKKCINT